MTGFNQKSNLLTEVTDAGEKFFDVVSKTYLKNQTKNPLNDN